jgi:yecA family protein
MSSETLPTYSKLSDVLDKTSLKMNAAQVHGLMCGLSLLGTAKPSAWEELILGKEKASKELDTLLQSLYTVTQHQLTSTLFEFEMVLPDDEAPLPERAECLTLWCQGFLTGMKIIDIPIVGRKPSDMTEAINDLIEIAKMNYEQVVATEEDEVAYTELVEYVRMAVILIYQETTSELDKPRSLH